MQVYQLRVQDMVSCRASIFGDCDMVTDAGVVALVGGCSKLQNIGLKSCYEVTNAGISA